VIKGEPDRLAFDFGNTLSLFPARQSDSQQNNMIDCNANELNRDQGAKKVREDSALPDFDHAEQLLGQEPFHLNTNSKQFNGDCEYFL